MSKEDQLYQALLDKHLAFYEALKSKHRRPRTMAQREFQDAAWGNKAPETDHEKAYVWHLQMTVGWELKESPCYKYRFSEDWEWGAKWDDAADSMRSWKPWHD